MVGKTVVPEGSVTLYSNVAGLKPSTEAPPTKISFKVASEDVSTENVMLYTLVAPVCAFTVILATPFTPFSSTRTT